MRKLCRINIEKSREIFEEIKKFARELKEKYGYEVYLFGSFAKGKVHEASDIDLIIIGNFKERFFERMMKIRKLTDLPVEPLAYTYKEFEELKKNSPFIKEIMKYAIKLA